MRTIYSVLGLALIIMTANTIAFADEPVGKQLSASEIKQKIIGNTTKFTNVKLNNFMAYWDPSGSMYGKNVSARGRTSGSWKITEDGQVCSSWNSAKWESGCRRLFIDEKTGEIRQYNLEGTLRATITDILPGNPENLN